MIRTNRKNRDRNMKMESCTSWIGGACFSPAERNWRERSRRSQTWYRCTNMAVIQRSNVIKRQRRKKSWLNEQAFYQIASTRWCSYSCCCRQPVTHLKLSWDSVMCFFSLSFLSPQHPPLLSLSLSLTQIHNSTCIKMQPTLNTTSRLTPEESECERVLVEILREIVKHFNARWSVNQKWLNLTRVFNTASLEKVTGDWSEMTGD